MDEIWKKKKEEKQKGKKPDLLLKLSRVLDLAF